MIVKFKHTVALVILVVMCWVAVASPASAHVTVKPAEVLTASFQTFTVSVPNEKDVAATEVKLIIPAGLQHVTPTVKPGWNITSQKQGEGDAAAITEIVWSGNKVPAGLRDDFTFSAQAPAAATTLQWKAYQTYENGTVVAWDLTQDQQPKKADGTPDFSASGPFSVTRVAAEQQSSGTQSNQGADRALYIAIAGVVLGLVNLFLITRKR